MENKTNVGSVVWLFHFRSNKTALPASKPRTQPVWKSVVIQLVDNALDEGYITAGLNPILLSPKTNSRVSQVRLCAHVTLDVSFS